MSSKINLDLKNFRHLKSDKNSTTLQHKTDGHQITLAHKALSPEAQTQLQALSGISKDAETPLQTDAMKHKMADGGGVGEGDRVPAPPTPTSDPTPKEKIRNVKEGATQTTGIPSDSPVKTGDWSHIWKAEGGEVKPEENVIDYSKFKRQPSPDGGTLDYKKIKEQKKEMNRREPPRRKLAEGGNIEEMQSQHGGDGNTCYACGGSIPRYAEGTLDVSGVQSIIPERLPDENPHSLDMAAKRNEYNDIAGAHASLDSWSPNPEDHSGVSAMKNAQFGPDGEAPQQFDPKAWEQMEDERAQSKQATAAQTANEALNTAEYNKAAQAAGIAPKPTDSVPGNMDTNGAQDQGLAQAQPQPQGQAQGQSQGQQPPDPNQGMGGYQGALTETANIQKEQLSHVIQARQQALDTWQNQQAQSENERQAHVQDIQNGHIDPNAYWQDHSKVAAGIGMILAGFNPSNRPNAAIEFLNNQINRSMDAQKSNLDSKNNLLRANLEHYRDMHSAQLMTNAMMNDTLAAQMQKAGLEAKNPLARQAAMNGANTLIQNAAMFQRQLDMQQTMMRLANGGGGSPESQAQAIAMMSAISPEHANVYRQAFVPGVGLSKSLTPVPQEVKDRINSYQNVNRMLNEALNFKKENPGASFSLGDRAKAETLMSNIGNEIRTAEKMGVVKPSEISMMSGMLGGSPASFISNIQTNPKLKEMIHLKQGEYNNLLQSNGLPVPATPKQQVQPVIRQTKDGRNALFNPETKQFLGYK